MSTNLTPLLNWPLRLRNSLPYVACAMLLCGLLAWVAVLPAIPVGGRDYVAFMQGVYRLQIGQVPHTDFYQPLGLLNFALAALLCKAGFPLYTALLLAVVLLAGILACCCLRVVRDVSLGSALVLALAVFLYGAGFVRLGEEGFSARPFFTIHLFYNRLGWAAILVSSLLLYTKAVGRRQLCTAEQLILSWCAFVCFYVKLSYFLLFALLLGSLLLYQWRTGVAIRLRWFCLGFVLLQLPVLWTFGTRLPANYLLDVLAAAQASAEVRAERLSHRTLARFSDPALLAQPILWDYLVCCIAVFGSRLTRLRVAGLALQWAWISVAMGFVMVYFSVTNSGPIEVPVLALPIFLVWIYLHLVARQSMLGRFFALAAAFAVLSRGVAVWGAVKAMQWPDLPLYDPGGHLGTVAQAPPEFVDYIEAAKRMLRLPPAVTSQKLLVLDLADILTPALQLAAPRQVPLFFHRPLIWSEHCAASFRYLTADVDIVMLPKHPLFPQETAHLLDQYGKALAESFDIRNTDANWIRYDRKPQFLKPEPGSIPQYYCARVEGQR